MTGSAPHQPIIDEQATALDTLQATPPLLDTAELKTLEAPPDVPFEIRRSNGGSLSFVSVLRHLPGKRVVGEARGPEGRVLAKLFVGDAGKRHWEREVSGIRALIRAGIPTPEIIAAEPLPDGGYLIFTRYIEGATTLGARAGELEAAEGRNEHEHVTALLGPCFRLVGQLHASGLVHHDLHPGNFLVAGRQMMLVDGDAVSGPMSADLTASEARVNLALLIAQFPMAWMLEPSPLLAEYRLGNPALPDDPIALASAVRKARDKRTADYLGKAGRNCSRYIARRHFQGMEVVARDREAALRPLIGDPDRFMAAGELLKQGNTATVARIRLGEAMWVVKRYNIKGFVHALSCALRPTRAWHSWLAAHRLQVLGIATPRPAAILERRFGPLRGRAWLVTENCPGRNLREMLDAAHAPHPIVGGTLVDLFKVLVAVRITHGDLKATNLLWHDGRIHLIDLDALTQHRGDAAFYKAWARDRARLLRNWPEDGPLHAWLDTHLPPAR